MLIGLYAMLCHALLVKKCSVELADVVAKLLNISLAKGNWKMAVVTPVPKVITPASLGDFQLISVTHILSRIAEKIVVKKWLYPAIPSSAIKDQFSYRPTGGTTCALINLLHHTSHTGWPKKIGNFPKFSTARIRRKFAMIRSLNILPKL